MRVLHVTDAYLPRLGGIEMHVHDLARAQADTGDEVDILTVTRSRGASDAPFGAFVHRPADDAGTWQKARFIWAERSRGLVEGYDVVHAHCSTMSPLSYTSIGFAGVPALMTVHSLWRRYTPLYRFGDHTLRWSRWPVRWSAVSESAAEAVRRAAAGPLDVAVLPNGVDLAAWGGEARSRAPGELRMIAVMRLAARKRPVPLLRMLRHVREQVPSTVRLSATIIGDGPQRPAMERFLERHDMGWVRLAGHMPRPEIAHTMTTADVFVAPAILESFGIAALEARAAGLPVVGRAGTGLSDFITGDGDGALVSSDREMAEVLAKMAVDGAVGAVPAPLDSLASMSWPSIVDRTRELYVDAGARRNIRRRAGVARAS